MPPGSWWPWIKLVHVSAAILWCASALGAFWYVIVAGWERRQSPDDPELRRRDDWVRRHFLTVVILEHVSFVVLVPTGLVLAGMVGLPLWSGWSGYKVGIALGIFVPLEIYDGWLSHWHLPRRLAERDRRPEAYATAVRQHDAFLVWGGVIVGVGIPVVLWLVMLKPA